MNKGDSQSRLHAISEAIRLEWLTLLWMSCEMIIGIFSGLAAH
jgi:hypothetical protein